MAQTNSEDMKDGCKSLYSFNDRHAVRDAIRASGAVGRVKAKPCRQCGKFHVVSKADNSKALSKSGKIPGYGKLKGLN